MAELVAIGYPDETSALVRALGRRGGTILKTSLSREGEAKLKAALHGVEDRETVTD